MEWIKTALAKAIARPVKNPVVPDHKCMGQADGRQAWRQTRVQGCSASVAQGFADTLKPLPAQGEVTARPEADADIYICFAKTAPELQAHLLSDARAASPDDVAGVAEKCIRPQIRAHGNVVRETGLRGGWVDFKVCALDDTWSGLAFKKRKA